MENKDKVISHLVAISNNNVIGVDNNLPWNLKGDLAHFKEYTLDKNIIMGRKTYESIGRPLPNRTNVIISRTLKDIPGAYVYFFLLYKTDHSHQQIWVYLRASRVLEKKKIKI